MLSVAAVDARCDQGHGAVTSRWPATGASPSALRPIARGKWLNPFGGTDRSGVGHVARSIHASEPCGRTRRDDDFHDVNAVRIEEPSVEGASGRCLQLRSAMRFGDRSPLAGRITGAGHAPFRLGSQFRKILHPCTTRALRSKGFESSSYPCQNRLGRRRGSPISLCRPSSAVPSEAYFDSPGGGSGNSLDLRSCGFPGGRCPFRSPDLALPPSTNWRFFGQTLASSQKISYFSVLQVCSPEQNGPRQVVLECPGEVPFFTTRGGSES